MQRNRKRMSPKVNGRLSSNYRHKHNSLFIHLLVHLFIQQTVMGFYIVTGSVRCVRIDGRAKLSPWPWGEDDGMRQWSCLTLGGCHLHVLDQLSALGGGSRGLTSFYPQGQGSEPFLRVETVDPLTSPLLKFYGSPIELLVAEEFSGELPDRPPLAICFLSHL